MRKVTNTESWPEEQEYSCNKVMLYLRPFKEGFQEEVVKDLKVDLGKA